MDTGGLLGQSDSCQKEGISHLPWAPGHCAGSVGWVWLSASAMRAQGRGVVSFCFPNSQWLFCRASLPLGVPQLVLLCDFPQLEGCELGFSWICMEPVDPLPVCTSPLGLWGYSLGMDPHNWLLPQLWFIGFPYSRFKMIYEQTHSAQAYIARSMIE